MGTTFTDRDASFDQLNLEAGTIPDIALTTSSSGFELDADLSLKTKA